MTEPKDMSNAELAEEAIELENEPNFAERLPSHYADTLLEIAARLRAMEWQPIESAPRDNTHILVSFPKPMKSTLNWSSRQVFNAYFSPQANDWCIEGQWVEEQKPTHWQHLPPPPE